jgi:hypothetical protein
MPSDHLQLLSDKQLAKFASWSLQLKRTVPDLLTESKFMLSDDGSGETVTLEGTLPNCGLYGAMLADGSTHT